MNFKPVYSLDVSTKMAEGPYIILGGNGLGKTTMMQSLVYALAGPLDATIEDKKQFRWDHRYFHGRIGEENINNAQVEVDFQFGKSSFSIRRGFKSSIELGVRLEKKWITSDASNLYEQILSEFGGYNEKSDFRFLVHRLLYLPENRRLIAWDVDAQVRLLMLINQDTGDEKEFRHMRAELKKLDSSKRHTHVDLEAAKKRMAQANAAGTATTKANGQGAKKTKQQQLSLQNLIKDFQFLNERIRNLEIQEKESLKGLTDISEKVEALREQIETAESNMFRELMHSTELEKILALGKLIEKDICPACGTKHTDFASKARHYLSEHKCILCGSNEHEEYKSDVTEERAKLDQLLKEQHAHEELVRLSRGERESLILPRLEVQTKIEELRTKRNQVIAKQLLDDPQVNLDLGSYIQELSDKEAEYEIQISNLKEKLSKEYDRFRENIRNRLVDFREIYQRYASAFLGEDCTLHDFTYEGMVDLDLSVPSFNDTVRPNPESCSEAERFFLDIAYRMSLIDFTSGETGRGTFICETPETALDFSYVDNVVRMFNSFVIDGNNLLLSANIQTEGIAKKLLANTTKGARSSHIVNLIEFGRLSNVQEAAIKQFKKNINAILNQA